jgi:hypothetical protein
MVADIKYGLTGGGSTWEVVSSKILRNKGNEYKLTRLLTPEVYGKLLELSRFRDGLLRESGILESVRVDWIFSSPDHVKVIINTLMARFGVWYGDQCKNSSRVIIISSNPLDIMRASSNTTFSSCYRVDGEYFNGTMTSALSPNTLIASIEDSNAPGYKIGRSWVYLNESMVIVGRRYGSIYDPQCNTIGEYVCDKVNDSCKWKLRPELKISHVMETRGPGYLDNSYGDVYLKNNRNLGPIIMPESMCLYCGQMHGNYGMLGVCRECANTVDKKLFRE